MDNNLCACCIVGYRFGDSLKKLSCGLIKYLLSINNIEKIFDLVEDREEVEKLLREKKFCKVAEIIADDNEYNIERIIELLPFDYKMCNVSNNLDCVYGIIISYDVIKSMDIEKYIKTIKAARRKFIRKHPYFTCKIHNFAREPDN